MCFGFRFTVVMYRGHILAGWENIFDIADIDGNRRGGQDFYYPPIFFLKGQSAWTEVEQDPLLFFGSEENGGACFLNCPWVRAWSIPGKIVWRPRTVSFLF
jgi:hypothetical protein